MGLPPDSTVVASDRQLSTNLAGAVEPVVHALVQAENNHFAGARIWELLQSPRTVADIVSTITAEFDADRERVASDLEALLSDLLSKRLIAITPSPADR
jgi:hypothetical protein